jgi:hypothetical protein
MIPLLGAERSQNKENTIPLPLEIVFRPAVQGRYNPDKPRLMGEHAAFIQYDFEPDDIVKGAIEPIENPWLMREEFLSPVAEGIALEGMTLVYGQFGVGPEDISVRVEKVFELLPDLRSSNSFLRAPVVRGHRLLVDEYTEWRSLVRRAMRTKMSAWPKLKSKYSPEKVDLLCRPMSITVEWRQGRPAGIISCSGIIQALIATLQIDALINAEYRFCACIGCTRSFKVKRQDQRYCSDPCKHRQAVRDVRERQRKTAQAEGKTTERRKSK